MKQLNALLLVGLLVGLILAGGYVQGRLSNRWGVPVDMKKKAELFDQVPEKFGDWRRVKTDELSDKVRDMLHCEGYIVHSYEHLPTGAVVNMFIILGPPGPTSVHTPEICYSSKNYDIREDRNVVDVATVDGEENTFWALTMKSRGVDADLLRVYYAWSPGGGWSASENPRFEFGGEPYLFKMQLAANLPLETDLKEGDACRNFLEAYLPVINPILLNASADAEPETAPEPAASDES